MKLNNFEYINELKLAKKLILLATKKITMHGANKIKVKKDKTIATNVDEEVEKYIIENILKAYPTDTFVSEEGHFRDKMKSRSWVLDPIDGTNTFFKGYDNWGTQICFAVNGEVKFAIIYLPDKNELYIGAKNCGVYLNGKKLEAPANTKLNMCAVEYLGKLDDSYEQSCFAKIFLGFIGKVLVNQYIWGSCVDFVNLASGKCDALVSSVDTLWDYLPGEFMVTELGATVFEFNEIIKVYTFSEDIIKQLKVIKGKGV